MTVLVDNGYPNLANIMARMRPDGQIVRMAEVLNKSLDIVQDVPWEECNLDLGHQISYRTGLPSAQWRRLNDGVSNTKTSGASFIESTGMMEDRAEMDVDQPGDQAAFRRQEEEGKIEMMTQEFARALFYESASINADKIHGLSARYAATTGYTCSPYVTKGTNAGVNCHSVWLISWKIGKVYGIYPKGSKAGLIRKDLGEVDCTGTTKGKFRGLATLIAWKCGIAVEDYRYAARHQWDPDDANYTDAGKGLYLAMLAMLNTVFKVDENARFYMDRTSFGKLQAQLASNSADYLKYVALGGRLVAHFNGVPIRVTDALVAETAIA